MPAAEDGEWSNWCSNVVCVRTKSSKDQESSPDGPVYHVQPIVVKSVYRDEPSVVPHPPFPRPVQQRRRITRLIQTPPVSSSSTLPLQYEGIGRVSLNLKAPPVYSVYDGPSSGFSRSVVPRRRSPIRVVLKKPIEPRFDYNLPDLSSSLAPSRDFRPITLKSTARSSSLPPFLSTAHARRSSIAVPSYSAASSYSGRPLGDAGSATSSLRRGSVDISYLSRGPDFYKSHHLRPVTPVVTPVAIPVVTPFVTPVVRSETSLRNPYRRGSLSVLGNENRRERPTYRSRTVGRFLEDELKSTPPASAPETLSSLRTRTQHARDKLDVHRSLLDRYLPGGSCSRESSIEPRFSHLANRHPELESSSLRSVDRRPSVSSQPWSVTAGSRAPSLERNDLISSVRRTPPPTSNMTPARRRIRNVLYKVSGDEEFLN